MYTPYITDAAISGTEQRPCFMQSLAFGLAARAGRLPPFLSLLSAFVSPQVFFLCLSLSAPCVQALNRSAFAKRSFYCQSSYCSPKVSAEGRWGCEVAHLFVAVVPFFCRSTLADESLPLREGYLCVHSCACAKTLPATLLNVCVYWLSV